MSARQTSAPGLVDYGLLFLLALIWGSAFVLSKVAVSELPPITVTLGRQIVASIVLGTIALGVARHWFRPDRRDWFFMVVCALTGTVLPFTLINWGVQVIDSGLAAVLMGLMPLIVLVLAHVLTDDEHLTVPKVIGVLIGLSGLAVLFWPQIVSGIGDNFARQVAVLGAAVCYAINAISTKRLLRHPPMVLMTYIIALTVPILSFGAFVFEEPLAVAPGPEVTAAVIAMGIFPSALGALLMFAIIRRQGAGFFGQINLLVPVAGVALGVLFLGERPGPSTLLALIIIFSGVAVARLKPAALQRTQSEGR